MVLLLAHFTGKKTEAQRCGLTCPRSYSQGRMELVCLAEEFGWGVADREWFFELGSSRVTVGALKASGRCIWLCFRLLGQRKWMQEEMLLETQQELPKRWMSKR